jgi:hypothetical protein
MHLIWSKGCSEIQIYKTANIDRRLFSKIRSDADYHPQKQTILSLIIALHLDMEEAVDLLARAGFALSPVNHIDTIFQFCIENAIYDFGIIDELIYEQTETINPYKAGTSY